MKTTNYSNARKNLSQIIEDVAQNNKPMTITKRSGEEVVLIAKTKFDKYQKIEKENTDLKNKMDKHPLLLIKNFFKKLFPRF